MADRDVDLTKDQEVQEYLDNLGTEYRFGCYSEKNPKGQLIHIFHSTCLISERFLFQLVNYLVNSWKLSTETLKKHSKYSSQIV